jgi:hypothetical protein
MRGFFAALRMTALREKQIFPFDFGQGQNDSEEQTTAEADSSASLRNDKQKGQAI